MSNQQEQVIQLLYHNPVGVGRSLGFPDLTDELHNEWLRWFLFGEDSGLLLAHRGSYKTTCIAIALAFICLLKPNKRTIFLRKTDDDVVEVLKLVQQIAKDPVYVELGRRLWGIDVRVTKATDVAFSLNIKRGLAGSPQVRGMGTSTSITGKHGDYIFYDDIVNKKDRVSRAERKAIHLLYQEFHNVVNRGGRLIGSGTPWHKEDAYSLIDPDSVHRYDYTRTGLISEDELTRLRSEMTPSLFAANYQLKHIADTEALFKTEPQFIDNLASLYNGILHVDAAYGGEDWTSATVIQKTKLGYVAYGKCWQKHVEKCMTDIKSIHERFRCGTIHVETNGDKGYLKKELRALGLPARGYHEKTNKYIKISSYGLKAWKDTRWYRDTDDDYLMQILDYTENAAHDDCPDSYASAVRQITKGSAVQIHLSDDSI